MSLIVIMILFHTGQCYYISSLVTKTLFGKVSKNIIIKKKQCYSIEIRNNIAEIFKTDKTRSVYDI